MNKLKASLKHSKNPEIKTSLFNLPPEFYKSIIKSVYFKDTGKETLITEISQNQDDYEWGKEFRARVGQGRYVCFKLFNGDTLTIHKHLLNFFKNEFETTGEDDEDNELLIFAEQDKYSASNVDLTDKGAILKRQREILKEIEDKRKAKQTKFDPFGTLASGLKLWFIILCQGGKFCIAKIQGDKIVEHKSDSKYVQRKKAGKRQINFDSKSSCMTSVGSQMRRNNERIHQEHIQEFLEEYSDDLEAADIIFLNAPGVNKLFFIGPEKPLRPLRHKVRTLPFAMKKSNFTELQRAFEEVIEIKIKFEE